MGFVVMPTPGALVNKTLLLIFSFIINKGTFEIEHLMYLKIGQNFL